MFFCAHIYSKRDCVNQNRHQQNEKLSEVTFLIIANINARFLLYVTVPVSDKVD